MEVGGSSLTLLSMNRINFLNEGGNMKKIIIAILFVLPILAACVAVPAGRGHHPRGVIIAPVLPPTVVLDPGPYYYHGGFHYYYKHDRWYYSKSNRGPWKNLPRDRYPRKVRYKKKGRHHDDRHHDDRRYDDRHHHDDRRHDDGHRGGPPSDSWDDRRR